MDQDQAEEDSVAKVLEYGVRTALEDGFLSRDNAKKLQRTCKALGLFASNFSNRADTLPLVNREKINVHTSFDKHKTYSSPPLSIC